MNVLNERKIVSTAITANLREGISRGAEKSQPSQCRSKSPPELLFIKLNYGYEGFAPGVSILQVTS